jgi:hypothetical protein
MVNFRYHIISITAVFLALGIGLALGANFIDKATVDTLRNQLDDLANDKSNLEEDITQLRNELDTQRQLAEQGGAQLLGGHLTDVSIVAVAVRGIDGDSFDATRESLVAAGATFAGTLWLTDRLALESADEIADLATILGQPVSADPSRLLRILTSRLGGVLASASQPSSAQPATEPVVPEPEPPLIAELRAAGFVEYEPPPAAPVAFAVLPARDARYLVVSGPGAVLADDSVVVPLLADLTATGPAMVVAAQAATGDQATVEATRTAFVGLLRTDDEIRSNLSTVDDVETFAGRVAVVLAIEQLAAGQYGHYGVGDGADSLVPPPLETG